MIFVHNYSYIVFEYKGAEIVMDWTWSILIVKVIKKLEGELHTIYILYLHKNEILMSQEEYDPKWID